MQFREVNRQWSDTIVKMRGDIIVSRGKVHYVKELPGYVAESGGQILGIVLYHIAGDECEIVTLNSYAENRGIGSKLIELVKEKAIISNCKRLWLITTNDNIRAIRFYQRRGFDMKCLHYNAVNEARRLKPSIPLYSPEGIPVKHEIEFEMLL